MSSEPNVHAPEWDAEMPDAPFRVRASRVGAHAGAEEPGATLPVIGAVLSAMAANGAPSAGED